LFLRNVDGAHVADAVLAARFSLGKYRQDDTGKQETACRDNDQYSSFHLLLFLPNVTR
jgi:hypothetical protein